MCLPGTIEAVREQETGVTRRAALAGGGAAALAAFLPAGAGAQRRRRRREEVVDLTHRFTAGFPLYTGAEPTRRTLVTIEDDGFYAQEWTFGEHSGTHLDAPGHFVTGARLVDELRPRELILPIEVIDISSAARQDPDVVLSPRHLRRHERRHGRIPRGALVAMDSGWARKVRDEAAYKGTDAGGTYHFPGFGDEAIEWLLERRNAAAIGVDTLSLDNGPSTTFGVHTTWLGADNYGIENLANLDKLPPSGAVAHVGVIPWEDGSGGPARVLATY